MKEFIMRLSKKKLQTGVAKAALVVAVAGIGASASADVALFFNDNKTAGQQTFANTIAAADQNATPQQTSTLFQIDMTDSQMTNGVYAVTSGGQTVYVITERLGARVFNGDFGQEGEDGFTNWSNQYGSFNFNTFTMDGTFSDARDLAYTVKFFSDSNLTNPFSMNAFGIFVNDWGTCCSINNPTPAGGLVNETQVYLAFDNSSPLLLGGISTQINSEEHFIGAINDTNFFNSVTVIANGNGEFFGVGGNLMFSSVALNSVPAGSSQLVSPGFVLPPPIIPDIDIGQAFYDTAQLAAGQVNPVFVGGTLRILSAGEFNNNFVISSQGGTVDTFGNDALFSGIISGTGQFIKTGAGTLTLAGANSYTGGTLVSAGRLAGNTTSLQGAITNNAQVEFAQTNAGTYTGAMSGTGQFIKTGAGTLTLTGANSYTGGTLVSAGRLAGDTTSLQGDVTNDAELEFAQGTDGSYTGVVSGTGQLIKTGAGTLTLTGANSYTGGTLVSAGRLAGNTTSLQGAIVNNAQVEFAQSTAGTYAGAMSGTGQFIKTGAGTLTLTGANSYTGGTLVSAGRLAGDTTSLQGDIANDAELEFAQGTDGSYTGVVTGTGQLIKTGAGTLTLSGANSYTGGTLVSAGRLAGDTTSLQGAIVNNSVVEFAQGAAGTYAGAMSGTGQLIKTGVGTLTLTGANSYTGGTLVSVGRLAGDTTSLQGDITNDAELEFAQGTYGSYTAVVSGTGQFIKTGAGTLTLTGANSYTGGTLVSAGRLAGDTTSLQGDVSNDAELEFAQGTDGSYTGVVSGAGQFIKTGAGTLTLTGANSYTGGTLVSAGRLAGNTTSLQGAIVNNAQVEFAQSTAGTYAGAMSGTGQFIKTGAGTLTLTGANSYTGGTLVSTGALVGSSLSLQGNVINNASVTFAQDTDGVFNGAISGSGKLIKTGVGTLTVTATNDFVGEIMLRNGGIKVDNGSSLGSGKITMADGTVIISESSGAVLVNDIDIRGSATFSSTSDSLILNGVIQDSNAFYIGSWQVDQGPDWFGGASTGPLAYSGQEAAALLFGGTGADYFISTRGSDADDIDFQSWYSVIGYGGNQGDGGSLFPQDYRQTFLGQFYGPSTGYPLGDENAPASAYVSDNARGDRFTNYAFDSRSVPGTLTKTGAGDLALNGANTYTGGTLLQQGSITLGNSRGLGSGNLEMYDGTQLNAGLADMTLSNTITLFGQSTINTNGHTLAVAGRLLGGGQLVKSGQGTLTLTGANSYSGGTLVSAGRLAGNTTSLQGAITNNAQVEFAQASAGTYAGAMSGTGQFVKTGTGTLTLTGVNSYTGGTLVSAGRLAGNTTSLQGAIVNNAEVEFAQANAATYADAMSGTGQFVKTGAGTLTLTGVNSYTGGTLVSAGRLAGSTTSLQGAIVNNAEVEFAQANAATYADAMSGTGQFVKTGTGTLTLTGANSYTGGTLVSAGRLAGNTTSLQGAITNNAQVEFAQANAGAYAGAISGAGGLIKTGAGTLTLTSTNSYSGGTLVSAGRLAGNTTSLQGTIANNAEVEFAQTSAGTYAGNMAGSGAFYKSGAGSLTLGGINSITGAANIIAGRLNISGQLAAGSVTVHNAATLSGNGVIGGNVIVHSGGSLAPGESAGTLSVVGNVSFLAGSNFAAEIDGRTYNPAGGAGSYDLLRVSGTANLGGTITPTLRGITGTATNNYLPSIGESFVVLSTTGTVAGNFSSIVQPSLGLPAGSRFDAIYGGDFVRLVITPGSFAALGNAQNWIGNGSSAARGIDNIRLAAGVRSGASQTLFNGLYGMNAGQLETAFSQISGEIYANSLQSVTETERSTFSSIFNASCDVSCGMPDGETNSNKSVWGRYIGKFANHDADQFASGYNSSSKGLLVGATLTDSNNLQFGVAASYVENEVATSLGASANANSTGGYLYVHYTPSDNFNVSSALGVSLSNTQVSRSIGTTAGRVSTNSEKQSMTVMYGTKASYRGFVNGPLSLWTDVGLELSDTTSGRVQERAVNSDFALSLDKLSRRSAETQMAARLQLASDDAQISLSAGWVYQLGDDPSALRNVELGGAHWTVRSVDAQRSGIRLGMQSRAQLSKRISLSAMYQHTNQGNGYTYDRANVGLNLAF